MPLLDIIGFTGIGFLFIGFFLQGLQQNITVWTKGYSELLQKRKNGQNPTLTNVGILLMAVGFILLAVVWFLH